MRIITKAVYQMENDGGLTLIELHDYEYFGHVDRLGGGPSQESKNAAAAQTALTSQLTNVAGQQQQFQQAQQNKANPYYTSLMQNGLSFMPALTDASKGLNAQAFQPQYSALNRRLSSMGGLPSGFREQALTDLGATKARSYDSNLVNNLMMNEQAKQTGASGLLGQAQIANPLGYYSGALQGNNSVMQAPLSSPGLAGTLGGLLGGIPF